MTLNFKLYIVALLGFVVADSIWIGLVMKKFYMEQMATFGRFNDGKFEPVMWSALIVYIVLALGVVEFVLPKIGADSNLVVVFLIGALMGLVIYGTYDFTNFATMKDWSIKLALVDVAWGMFVTGLVSVITRLGSNYLS